MEENKLAIFQGKEVRRLIHNNEWWFSVVDVVRVLTDSPTPRQYWEKIKIRDYNDFQLSPNWGQLKDEERLKLSTICRRLKLLKRWLAKIGYERAKEIED